MVDIVDATTRSRMMAGIRGKNTRPEMLVRKGLHARGFRFRLHSKKLPGKPDLALAQYKAVIFINGCFWHGHDCPFFRLPGTRREFWSEKIEGTRSRDARAIAALNAIGWRSLIIWECALRGQGQEAIESVIDRASSWILNGLVHEQIRGR